MTSAYLEFGYVRNARRSKAGRGPSSDALEQTPASAKSVLESKHSYVRARSLAWCERRICNKTSL